MSDQITAIKDLDLSVHPTMYADYYNKYTRRGWFADRVRERVVESFKILRKEHGLLTRVNFRDCQSCAGAEIGIMIEKKTQDKLDKLIGYAYWHNQDEEVFKEDHSLQEGDGLYIAFGGLDKETDKRVKKEHLSEDIGHIIKAVLQGKGLDVEWDGDVNKRIFVKCYYEETEEDLKRGKESYKKWSERHD